MEGLWIGVTLLAGWLVAWIFGRQWRGATVARLLMAGAASVVLAYFVVRSAEHRFSELLFLALGVSLLIREAVRLGRGGYRKAAS